MTSDKGDRSGKTGVGQTLRGLMCWTQSDYPSGARALPQDIRQKGQGNEWLCKTILNAERDGVGKNSHVKGHEDDLGQSCGGGKRNKL